MSFGGDLRTFDVFDLLGWLTGRKRPGVLQMTRRSTKKRLAFRDVERHAVDGDQLFAAPAPPADAKAHGEVTHRQRRGLRR